MDNEPITKPYKTASFPLRLTAYFAMVSLMANINGIVDMFEHPEIPYFDKEHLIVGLTSGLISVILVTLLEVYLRSLHKALEKISLLESFLSICADCKKIQSPGTDPRKKESWSPIENYITEKTRTLFSHGICPDCLKKYRAQLEKESPATRSE